MADERMPENMVAWMNKKGWGQHRDQWHFERRWDFWHARAALPGAPAWIAQMIQEAKDKGWQRSPTQEGEAGNGEDFLYMHRAMIALLLDEFPEHLHFLRGWHAVPQDPADTEDAVPADLPGDPPNPAKGAFNADMAAGLAKLEAQPQAFDGDDGFGLFLQTRMRPTPGNPLAVSPDPQTGAHNYLHNRWSDNASPINIGDPTVNIFNTRFWKLHGWIDFRWWRFRRAAGLDDAAASYQNKLAFYKTMMGQDHHHHHFEAVMKINAKKAATRNVFQFDGP
jgi:hypothetical protein